ncbi:MAG: Rab family GTPase [Promethearchaeia archaeon]
METNQHNKENYRQKVIVLGDGAVGKTTLTKRFLTGVFKENYKLTIGMDFYVTKVELEDKIVKLQIWDFAGEEKFRFLLPSVAQGAKGAIFMYDLTRYKTLEHLKEWQSVFRFANKQHHQEVPAILVGGKSDLKDLRVISREEGEKFARKHNFQSFLECSAKTGENVKEVFKELAHVIVEEQEIIT